MARSMPSSWSSVKIEELAAGDGGLFVDGDWIESKDQSPNGSIRLLQVGNVLRGRLRLDGTHRWVTNETAERLGCTLLSRGDILIARMPDPIGRACIVPKLPYAAITAVDCAILRVMDSRYSRQFIVQVLNSDEQIGKVASHVSGTTRQRVSRSNLGHLDLVLPPLGEQRKIASILSSVDEAIAKTQVLIEELQVVKKAMMQHLLTCGMPGRHTRFKDTSIGTMPYTWAVTTLLDVCTEGGLQTGPFGSQLKAEEYTPDGIPVIMPKDLIEQCVSTETVARIPESRAAQLSQHRVEPGDLVFARRGDIGRCALIEENERGWICGTGCLRARLARDADPRFLAVVFGYEPVVNWLIEHAVGQTMLNLNTDILGRVPIPLPPLDEQAQIAAGVSQVREAINANVDTLSKLSAMKSAFLSLLLSGEIRVTPDPEPTP